jgi:hypothetical protein
MSLSRKDAEWCRVWAGAASFPTSRRQRARYPDFLHAALSDGRACGFHRGKPHETYERDQTSQGIRGMGHPHRWQGQRVHSILNLPQASRLLRMTFLRRSEPNRGDRSTQFRSPSLLRWHSVAIAVAVHHSTRRTRAFAARRDHSLTSRLPGSEVNSLKAAFWQTRGCQGCSI